MFKDEYSDKESEFEERSPEESPRVTRKTLSTIGFRNIEKQSARPLALRATQSFTGTLDELRLAGNLQRVTLSPQITVPKRTNPICPCGCLLQPAPIGPFRTREKQTLALNVVPPEVLNYHGYNFDPSQIAMFWKKDCRAFLWKGKSRLKNNVHMDSH